MPIAQVNKCISCRTAKLGLSCKRMLFTIHDHQAIPSAGCLNFLWHNHYFGLVCRPHMEI